MINQFMSWEGGVDLVGIYNGASEPNLIVHVARMVHTPVGSAPAGMVLVQPDPAAAPELIGFVSTDPTVGAYFGPNIFAGTPFEQAPVLDAQIETHYDTHGASASVKVGETLIELKLTGLAALQRHNRSPLATAPFNQDVLEADASAVDLKINGEPVALTLPPQSISGGHAAVSSPTGIYSR